MIEHPVARHPAVPVAMRPRESGAGGGERLEAEALQVACASHVPWVGNDEASCLVQFVKCATLVGNAGTDVGHALLLKEVFGGYCARGGELLHAMENLRARRETVHANRCTRRRTRTPRGFRVPYCR